MKKIKFLLLFFAAFFVAEVCYSQAVHVEYVEVDGVMYCLDEPIMGQMHYRNIYLYDKEGNVKKFTFVIENSWFVGVETGELYKLVDVGSAKPDYLFPFPTIEDNMEWELVNNMKIICKGTGKVYSGRVQIKFEFNKEGDLISVKNINTTCF